MNQLPWGYYDNQIVWFKMSSHFFLHDTFTDFNCNLNLFVTLGMKRRGGDVLKRTVTYKPRKFCRSILQPLSEMTSSGITWRLNFSINQHISFTMEEEKDGSIAFLDTKTTRNPDGTIKSSVYRKATISPIQLLSPFSAQTPSS